MIFQKIILRAPEPEDLSLLYNWENDPSIWKLGNSFSPYSKETIKNHIENSQKSIFETGQQRFMIELINNGPTIGTIDIFDFDPFHLRAGIGILIADKGQRRKGYAGMALQCLIEYCFSHMKMHQLYCNIAESNHASISLFSDHGFKVIGTKTDWRRSENGFSNEIMFQLISDKSLNNNK